MQWRVVIFRNYRNHISMMLVVSQLILTVIPLAIGLRDKVLETKQDFWYEIAKQELNGALQAQKLNTKVAKNIILFLGDGMGVSTMTAGRIYKGQKRGKGAEETKLAMDLFPHVALSKTYSTDSQVPDSAATATAYLCGVKTNGMILGLTSAAEPGNCWSASGSRVNSILEDAAKSGKSTGIVTTTRIQHATPAGSYAHTPSRKWYGDNKLSDEAKLNGCKDIAMQFYEASEIITVAMGGGRTYMQPNNTTDPEYTSKQNSRQDGLDLIEMWKKKMSDLGETHKYVWNKEQFNNVDPKVTDRLLGLFEPKDMKFEALRMIDNAGEPSLAEMTTKAIEILQKNDKGYFLLVEGGRIDHGHHSNSAYMALNELTAFDDAIEAAVNMTSDDETLVIATADHSHVFTISGYPERGNDILGLAPSNTNPKKALDDKYYTTLLYGNGPGYQGHYFRDDVTGYMAPFLNYTYRKNVTSAEATSLKFLQQSAVPLSSETHAGEDVAILAKGPMAHLFHGVHEQHYIAYAMRYASCVGSDKRHCEESKEKNDNLISYLNQMISEEKATLLLHIQFAMLLVLTAIIVVGFPCLILKHRRSSKGQNQNGMKHANL